MPTTAEKMRDDYDWKEAWAYGGKHEGTEAGNQGGPVSPTVCEGGSCSSEPLGASDIAEVIATSVGENDEREWVAVARLKDGRYAFVAAWCDYTGWDCQADGQVWVSDSLENLWQFGVTQDARDRLGDRPPEGVQLMPLSYFLIAATTAIPSLDVLIERGDAGSAVVGCMLIALLTCNAVALNPWRTD